jgi:hypothetical protein
MRSASLNTQIPFTTLDLVNLPASGVAGTDVVTSVVGVEWKPNANIELGAGFEFPLTDRSDIVNNRAYADLIFRF